MTEQSKKTLKVLIVEDSQADMELVVHTLERGGYDVTFQRVQSESDMREALSQETWDIVISDFAMPQFDGLSALELARKEGGDVPFVLVSGSLGEEMAVTAMKAGADDYIIKDKLARLVPAVRRELEQSNVRRERTRARQAEHEQRVLSEALRETVSALNSTLKFEEILDQILLHVGRVVAHDAANVMLVENGMARTIRARGYLERGGPDVIGIRIPFDKLAGDSRGVSIKSPVLVRDTRTDPRWFEIPETSWVRSFIGMPIVIDREIIGFINLDSAQPNFFQASDSARLEAFADQVAVAMQRARLFEQTERQLAQLQALRRIDNAITSSLDLQLTLDVLLDQVTTLLRVDAAVVLLVREDGRRFEYAAGRGFRSTSAQNRPRRTEGLAGQVVAERRVIHIPNFSQAREVVTDAPELAPEEFVEYYGVPLIVKGDVNGVLEIYHRSPLVLSNDWHEFLNALAGQAGIAIDNFTLFEGLQQSNAELMQAYDATIEGWSYALDLRDKETEGHTQRVTTLTLELAQAMGIPAADLAQMRRGALLHDIGKMGIPDNILLKPSGLTPHEWSIMRQHPLFAYQMLSRIAYLQGALDIPYCHHEKWDGTGYPRGLKGEAIPLSARIFAVVDVYDALCSERPYREAWSRERALQYIQEQSGTHFDPAVVDVFMQMKFPLFVQESVS